MPGTSSVSIDKTSEDLDFVGGPRSPCPQHGVAMPAGVTRLQDPKSPSSPACASLREALRAGRSRATCCFSRMLSFEGLAEMIAAKSCSFTKNCILEGRAPSRPKEQGSDIAEFSRNLVPWMARRCAESVFVRVKLFLKEGPRGLGPFHTMQQSIIRNPYTLRGGPWICRPSGGV